jgi:hypothetical protein
MIALIVQPSIENCSSALVLVCLALSRVVHGVKSMGLFLALGRGVNALQNKREIVMLKLFIVTGSTIGLVSAAAAADLPRKEPPPPTPVVGKAPIGKVPIIGKLPGKTVVTKG